MGVVQISDATQAGTGHMPQAHTYVITRVSLSCEEGSTCYGLLPL